MSWKVLLLLVAVPLTAAGNLIAGRLALESFSPAEANALRYSLALVVLAPMIPRWPRPTWREVPVLAATGVVGIAIYNLLFFSSLQLIPASVAALLEMLIPAASLFLAWTLLREKVVPLQVVGIAVSWIGSLWLLQVLPSGAIAPDSGKSWWGEILMVIAVGCFAVYAIISKFAMRRLPPPAVATWSCIFGTCALLVISAPSLADPSATLASASLTSWLAVLYGGLVGFVFNIIAWYYCFRAVGVGYTNTFLYLVPIFGALMAMPIFDERLTGWQVFGAGMTCVGVVLATWRTGAKSDAMDD